MPEGDLLLHAGDLSMGGTVKEISRFNAWLGRLPHPHKVVIAGNHDWLFERDPAAARRLITNAVYLEDEEATVAGLRIWGSPWQPWFMSWAFNLRRGAPLRAKWSLIPPGIDVLLTHGPPHGIRDRVASGEHVGCEELAVAVARLRPRLHVFGHIHEGYGREQRDATLFVNASTCDPAYRPVQPPVVLDL